MGPESSSMTDTPPTKLLPKTFSRFKVICTTPYTATVEEKGFHDTPSIDRVTLYFYNTRHNDGNNQNSYMQNSMVAECNTEQMKSTLV